MNKFIRTTSAATATVLAVSALTGCSAYSNPGKYITVPEKKSVSLKKSDIDKAYDEEILDILEDNYRDTDFTELEDESETVKDGDQVSIRYYGRAADEDVELSEETIASMSNVDADKDTDLVIGSGAFIGAYESDEEGKSTEGFEEQLIGWKKGDTGDITVTFPDDYKNSTELQGKVVIFHVTIKKISRAYVNDDTTIKVSYEFDDGEEEEEEEEDEAAATSETAPGTTAPATTAPETEEEEFPLSDVFKKSSFTIDYTDDIDEEATFNDLFLIKDYVEMFKEKAMNYEYSFEFTVTEEAVEAYKDKAEKDKDKYDDYIGRTFTVKLTVTEITSLPEWTDELVSEYTNETYKTVAEFEEYLRKNIIAQQALEAIIDATVVNDWPKSERKKIYKQYVDSLVTQRLGADPSTMTQKEVDAILTDEVYAAIYASAAESTLVQLKQTLVYEYLFKEFEIKISNKEYKELLSAEFAANAWYYYYYSNYTVMSEDTLEAYVGKDNLMFQFKASKLAEVIGEYVTIDEAY